MHNHKKTTTPPTDAEIAALNKKKETYQSLTNILFSRRVALFDSNETPPHDMAGTFELTTKMLLSNPDFYSIWNMRKVILIKTHAGLGLSHVVPCKEDRINTDIGGHIRQQELDISSDCIKRNPKSCKSSQIHK
jgi:Protein prenyltransferase alpha subunit repeat